VLSSQEWNNLEEKIRSMPISKSRSLQRFFFSGATEVTTDKQGRVLLPQHLREHANLDKDATFIGASSRAEIWDTKKWLELSSQIEEDDIAKVMDELGV
jgi:MraZ protein